MCAYNTRFRRAIELISSAHQHQTKQTQSALIFNYILMRRFCEQICWFFFSFFFVLAHVDFVFVLMFQGSFTFTMFKVFFKKDLPVNWMRDNGCRSNWTNAPRLCLLILSFCFSFLLRMRKIVLHLSCSLRFASAAALATAVLHIAERTTINLWRFFLFAVCLKLPRSTHLSFDGIVRQSGSRIKSLIMPPPVICSVCAAKDYRYAQIRARGPVGGALFGPQ